MISLRGAVTGTGWRSVRTAFFCRFSGIPPNLAWDLRRVQAGTGGLDHPAHGGDQPCGPVPGRVDPVPDRAGRHVDPAGGPPVPGALSSAEASSAAPTIATSYPRRGSHPAGSRTWDTLQARHRARAGVALTTVPSRPRTRRGKARD